VLRPLNGQIKIRPNSHYAKIMFPMAPNTYKREGIEENMDRVFEHYMTYYYPFIK
jgi:hypothetical protein